MNDLNKMPPKCQSCPYWELAEEPYFCEDCTDKKHSYEHKVLIYKDDVIKLVKTVIDNRKKILNNEEVVAVNDLNKLIEELSKFTK